MKRILFKDCKFLFALPEHGGITSGNSVYVEGQDIKAVGKYHEILNAYPSIKEADIVDCSMKIVLPGLVDGHNHLCNTHMNLARIILLNYGDIAAHMMATIHDPYGWMTEECLYDISTASIVTDVKNGATTIENSTIMPDIAFRAMDNAGIRGILAPQMATSFRLASDALNYKEMLARTEKNILDYHNPKGRITVAVHVHDLWDTLEEVMLSGMRLAEKYNTKYVTHFWEFQNAVDRMEAIYKEKGGALTHYLDKGLVNERCVLFHGSMLNEREIERVAKTGASIIHNPDINGTNCGNCAYIPYMLKEGINIGIGSDYGSLDVKTAMKLMLFAHNIMPRTFKALQPHAPFSAATMGGARAYGLEDQIGSITPGKRADLITFDLRSASELLPMCTSVIDYDPSILYFLFARNAAGLHTSESMVDGEFLRRNGKFTQLDEEAITQKAADWCERFIPELTAAHREGKHFVHTVHPDFMRDEAIPRDLLA